jgi:hypothetical protein
MQNAHRIGFILAALLSMTGVHAAAAEQITIARLSGTVQLSEGGKSIAPRLGLKMSLPLRVQTGGDGNVRLEHSGASLDVGPDSIVVIPGGKQSTSALEKIQQQLGRVLYSVKPRKTQPLVVETPYLVSVVKGTTFSIAVDERSTAVALLEGSLQISGPGVDQGVLLAPNQTAIRDRDSRSISVTTIETSAPPLPPQAAAPSSPMTSPVALAHQEQIGSHTGASQDLSAITAAYVDRRASAPQPPTVPQPQPQPEPQPAPQPAPDSEPESPPQPEPVPSPDPSPAPEPQPDPSPAPVPQPDDDHDYDDDSDDDDDDGNSGHGNDEDDKDDSNPGNSGKKDR